MCSSAPWSLSSCRGPSWLWNLHGSNAGRWEQSHPGLLASAHHLMMACTIIAGLPAVLMCCHWVGSACQPNWWLLIVWTWCLIPLPSYVLLEIAFHKTGWPSLGPSLLLLLGNICHLRACLPPLVPARHVGVGGVVPTSLIKITWISKQYWVTGWSGICLLTWDWDGECNGALLDASVSLGPFWPFGGVRVWPSIWTVTPDFWLSRLLE